MAYAEIYAEFQQELRLPIARLVDTLRDELGIGRADFEELKAIVRELAQAQQRTESSVEALRGAVQGLVEAQQLTELRMQELAQAQQRTEFHVDELGEAVQRLAEEHRLFRYSFDSKLGGLKLIVTPFVDNRAKELGLRLGKDTIIHDPSGDFRF
jgi:hypothetical protein